MVHYGTSVDTLDSMSDLKIGSNFTAINDKFAITLKDLMPNTMYFYLVNSTNTNGSVLSTVAIFTTEGMVPCRLYIEDVLMAICSSHAASDSFPKAVVGGAATAAAVVIVILCIVIIVAWR